MLLSSSAERMSCWAENGATMSTRTNKSEALIIYCNYMFCCLNLPTYYIAD